jgi:hypothetical protein
MAQPNKHDYFDLTPLATNERPHLILYPHSPNPPNLAASLRCPRASIDGWLPGIPCRRPVATGDASPLTIPSPNTGKCLCSQDGSGQLHDADVYRRPAEASQITGGAASRTTGGPVAEVHD